MHRKKKKKVIFSEKEMNKHAICAKGKEEGMEGERRKNERNLVFALKGFSLKVFSVCWQC